MVKKLIGFIGLSLILLVGVSLQAQSLLGAKAPEFSLPDQSGKIHDLKDYRGKWVILYFYPRDHTSGCTVEAAAFRDMKSDFDTHNAVILGVSVDGIESHKSFHNDMKLNFDLLSDEETTTSKDYNVLTDLLVVNYSQRQTFIIDPMGMVAHHFEDVDPDTHAHDAMAKLKEVQKIYAE